MELLKTWIKSLVMSCFVLAMITITCPQFAFCRYQKDVDVLGNELERMQEQLSEKLEQLSDKVDAIMDSMNLPVENKEEEWPYLTVLDIGVTVLETTLEVRYTVVYWLSSTIEDIREIWYESNSGAVNPAFIERTTVSEHRDGVIYESCANVPETSGMAVTMHLFSESHPARYSVSFEMYPRITSVPMHEITLKETRVLNKDELTPDNRGNLHLHIEIRGSLEQQFDVSDVSINYEYLNTTTNTIVSKSCDFQPYYTQPVICQIKSNSVLQYRRGLTYIVTIEKISADVQLMGFVRLRTFSPYRIVQLEYIVPVHTQGQTQPYPDGYLEVKSSVSNGRACQIDFDLTTDCVLQCFATGLDISDLTAVIVLPDGTTRQLTPSTETSLGGSLSSYHQELQSPLPAVDVTDGEVNITYVCFATGAGGRVEEQSDFVTFYRRVEFVPGESYAEFNETTVTISCTLQGSPTLDLSRMSVSCISGGPDYETEDVVVIPPEDFSVLYRDNEGKITVTASTPYPDSAVGMEISMFHCFFFCERNVSSNLLPFTSSYHQGTLNAAF